MPANIWIELDVYTYGTPEEAKEAELLGKTNEKPSQVSPLVVNFSNVAYIDFDEDNKQETELTMVHGGVLTAKIPRNILLGILNKAGDLILLQANTEDLPEVKVISLKTEKEDT